MYQAIKRLFDFICALAGIIGTSPIWLFSIIMTELSDPGPLFYFAKSVLTKLHYVRTRIEYSGGVR